MQPEAHSVHALPSPRALVRGLAPIVVLALGVAWASPAEGGLSEHHPRVVAEFAADAEFAESMAVDGEGNVFAAVTRWGQELNGGRIWTISPDGDRERFGPWINAGYGLLTGVAFGEGGDLYVVVASFSTSPRPRILRLDPSGSAELVARLPADSFPNGIAVHGNAVYVSDSALGVIWKIHDRARGGVATRWLEDDVLLPGGSGNDIGANGIAFRGDRLYVAVSDPGLIVRVALRPDGSAGRPVVIARKPALSTADGIAFDIRGQLWIAANENRLLRLSPRGPLHRFAAGSRWLNYPTEMVFGPRRDGATLLYIENGAFNGGTPNILEAQIQVRGLPTP